jgi:hypothetical protein
VHSDLDDSDIDHVLEVCWKIRDEVRPDRWPAGRQGRAARSVATPRARDVGLAPSPAGS